MSGKQVPCSQARVAAGEEDRESCLLCGFSDGQGLGLRAAERGLLPLPQRLVQAQVLGHDQHALSLHLLQPPCPD
jgi:hypothetical protein